ncbi:hypothetical protein NDU88_005041, partial [Pleurodeles waltl]
LGKARNGNQRRSAHILGGCARRGDMRLPLPSVAAAWIPPRSPSPCSYSAPLSSAWGSSRARIPPT